MVQQSVLKNGVMSKHIPWVDTAKVIGIYLMILGHILNNERPIEAEIFSIIYAFHMPFFYFISGYLYNNKKMCYGRYIMRKTISLIVPYVLFNMLSLILLLPLYWMQKKPIAADLLTLYDGHMGSAFAGATWFLVCLYIVMLIFYFVAKLPNLYKIIICIFCVVLSYFVSGKQLLFDLQQVPCSFAFFSLGYMLKGKIPDWSHSRWMGVVSICSLIVYVMSTLYNGLVAVDYVIGNTYSLFYPNAILGIFTLIVISQFCARNSFYERVLSSGTIVVLGFHAILIKYSMDFCLVNHSFHIPLVLREFLLSGLILVLFVPINIFVSRYFPPLMGFRNSYSKMAK